MAYSKTTWKDNEAPYLNANNLNKIETGIDNNDAQIVDNTAQIEQNTTDIADNRTDIDINSDNILGLTVGEVYQGTWTPEAGTEYPSSPESGWSYYIQFLDDDGYTFTSGDLSGRIANNSDKIIYNGTSWSMIDNTNEQLGYYLVDDIESMLGLSPLQGALCQVYGYYEANDGGGGTFNYDSAQAGTNNGGTIFDGWVRQYSGAVNVKWFGIDASGALDTTANFKFIMETFSDVFIPKGDYLIAGTGVDSGGVVSDLTKSLSITCEDKARFFTDDLDNPMFTITGTDGISINWTGGLFDMTEQKVSLVVPYLTEYPPPPGKDGGSTVTDGLHILGNGANVVEVSGARFISGTHWQTAGGDSGLFVDGADIINIHDNYFKGIRDAGVYLSSDVTGTQLVSASIYSNYFVNCFVGEAIKRGIRGFSIHGNTHVNCVRGTTLERVTGDGNLGGMITSNEYINCGEQIECDYSKNITVSNNSFYDAGCLLEDGVSIEPVVVKTGITISGVENSIISNNVYKGIQSAYITAGTQFNMFNLADFSDGEVVADSATHCLFSNNLMDGWYGLATDIGTDNRFIYNSAVNSTLSKMVLTGTNASEIAIDPATNQPLHTTPTQHEDGSSSACTISRRGQNTVGMFFQTNRVNIVGGTTATQFSLSDTGVGFSGNEPILKPTISGVRSDPEVALKLLLQALEDYGLILDTTTT